MKGLFALIAIMTDFMASVPKVIIIALLGGITAVVCGMCAYCCHCHKPHEVEDSDDEDESPRDTQRGEVAKKQQPQDRL